MLVSCLSPELLQSADDLEHYLLEQRTPALDALNLPGDLVLPCPGISIANLPATLAEALGGKLPAAAAPLPDAMWTDLASGVRRVIWILLDAVGWQQFRDLLEQEENLSLARLARRGRLLPITAVVPSTTTSALVTLWTGYAPTQHGLVAHMMYLRRLGLVADMLMFSPAGAARREELIERGITPEEFLPVPGLGQALGEQGIVTRALINVDLAKTAFSRLTFRGVAEVGRFVTEADMWVQIREAMLARREERLLLVGYLAEMDTIGHLKQPGSDSWRAELRSLAFSLEHEFLRRLSPREREGTLLVITADHGQVPEPGIPVPLADHPGLADHLLLPACGSLRAAYLYARQGQVEAARGYLQEHLAQQFAVVDAQAGLEAGILGPGQPADDVATRVGDLMLFGRDNYMLDYRRRPNPPLGMHAGLSASEMLVPLLMARLD